MIEPYSTEYLWLIIVGFIMAFVLAFGIGANDVANSFGTSVGSKVLTIRQACCLATVFEIAGAVLIGYKVAETIRKGIFQIDLYANSEYELMLGMFASLIGASIMLLGATFFSLPVSATHSIVGATVGFSLVARGTGGIDWVSFGTIVASWFISPVLSGLISAILFLLIRRFVLNAPKPMVPGLYALPIFYGVTLLINAFSIVHDGPSLLYFDRIPLWGAIVASLGVGALAALIVQFFLVPYMRKQIKAVLGSLAAEGKESESESESIKKTSDALSLNGIQKETALTEVNEQKKQISKEADNSDKVQPNGIYATPMSKDQIVVNGQDNQAFSPSPDDNTAESVSENEKPKRVDQLDDPPEVAKLFTFLQILTATFGSFAHGGNDVSNAIGPLVSLWLIYTEGTALEKAETPIYILFYGGVGIAVGLWVWGRRVIKTIGEDLTKIVPSTGFTIEIGAAFTVLLASKIGLPISTTHCKVGSVVFVGWASTSKQGVDWKLFRNIIGGWIVTVPIAGGCSAAAMAILRAIAL